MSDTVMQNPDMQASRSGDDESAARNRYLKLWDIGVLLAALLIFFVFMMVLVRIVFPQGARLADMTVQSQAESTETPGTGSIEIAGAAGDFNHFKAFLGDIRRDVKIRAGDGVAWTSARKGGEVRDRDAVQTYSNSRARVDFTSDNRLRIGQNSLVVFGNGAADPFLARREPAAVVMEGELSGEVNADYGAFAIEFPAGLVELTADESSNEAVNFRVGVNPDQSSTIAVYSGEADINIAGEHFKVGANEGITFSKDGVTAGVMDLPTSPVIRAPRNDTAARFLRTPPRVTFAWDIAGSATKYRLEIATDASFESIVVDEALNQKSFVHGNLPAGEYFWRVSAINGWVQGPVTGPQRLMVVQDLTPPSLNLQPIERMAENRYLLRGSTSRNASVFAAGEVVRTNASGEFEHQFAPAPGTRAIVVESVDDVGNVTYQSQLLHVPGMAGRSVLP